MAWKLMDQCSNCLLLQDNCIYLSIFTNSQHSVISCRRLVHSAAIFSWTSATACDTLVWSRDEWDAIVLSLWQTLSSCSLFSRPPCCWGVGWWCLGLMRDTKQVWRSSPVKIYYIKMIYQHSVNIYHVEAYLGHRCTFFLNWLYLC